MVGVPGKFVYSRAAGTTPQCGEGANGFPVNDRQELFSNFGKRLATSSCRKYRSCAVAAVGLSRRALASSSSRGIMKTLRWTWSSPC